jgi:inositol phosphorylceramide mannosyltransferase catalytic subunit
LSIPRIIHQVWLGGEPPAEVAGWLETWAAHHPGWEHLVWNDGNVPVLQNQSLFDAASSYAMKADILRLEVLLKWGGVYVDADYECHRPIDGLVDGVPLILLSEGPILTNSFIAATPGHRLIQTLVEALSKVDPFDVTTGHASVLSTSGPKFLTRTLSTCEWMGPTEMRILPPDYFLLPQSRERDVQQWAATRRYATHHALRSWGRRTLGSLVRETRLKTRVRRFLDLEAT